MASPWLAIIYELLKIASAIWPTEPEKYAYALNVVVEVFYPGQPLQNLIKQINGEEIDPTLIKEVDVVEEDD